MYRLTQACDLCHANITPLKRKTAQTRSCPAKNPGCDYRYLVCATCANQPESMQAEKMLHCPICDKSHSFFTPQVQLPVKTIKLAIVDLTKSDITAKIKAVTSTSVAANGAAAAASAAAIFVDNQQHYAFDLCETSPDIIAICLSACDIDPKVWVFDQQIIMALQQTVYRSKSPPAKVVVLIQHPEPCHNRPACTLKKNNAQAMKSFPKSKIVVKNIESGDFPVQFLRELIAQ